MKTKAILFDLGNILISFNDTKACAKLSEYSPLTAEQIYELIYETGLRAQYDEGKLTSEGFYNAVREMINAKPELTFEVFSEIWNNILAIDEEIEKLLSRIDPAVILLLASNTNELHHTHLRATTLFERFFAEESRVFVSYNIGRQKPELEFYTEVLLRTGLRPEEIFHIDDDPTHVDEFRSIGGTGTVFNTQKDTLQDLEQILSSIHVLA